MDGVPEVYPPDADTVKDLLESMVGDIIHVCIDPIPIDR